MRLVAIFMLMLSAVHMNIAYAENKTDTLNDYTSKINYSVGYQIGSDFKYQETEVRIDAIIKGIEDAVSDSQPMMSKQEMNQTMAALGKKVTEIKQKLRKQYTEEYAEKNRQFLVENSKKKGIVTTESGLQYKIVDAYRGNSGRKRPKPDSKVLVNYTGKLIDGTVFDSSYKRGKPSNFKVDQVIKGWSEALQIMRQGDHWMLFIPAELAYAEKGAGSSVPPNSTLIFDVELIAVQ